MRIIAGEFRGRRLLPPEGDTTRPITDRVKQSLFDILTPLIPDAIVYDCFAGTGSMGLECLSRGAAQSTFFEADRSAAKRLEKNIATLGVGERSKVVQGDLFKWFDAGSDADKNAGADLIFLDPPYRFLVEKPQALQRLAERAASHHLALEGIVILRRDAKDRIELPALERYDLREYGSMAIEFLRRSEVAP
ncbi:MAG: 16S rRNA (guanine(966)-N(2))-methyltransferase RsmD [Tepidisphaeraceae bacterium]